MSLTMDEILEAERAGTLSPRKRELLAEARRRGLVAAGDPAAGAGGGGLAAGEADAGAAMPGGGFAACAA